MAQCTAKSKQSGERCKRHASEGFTVCAIHGGKSKVGTENPAFRHGRYVKHLPESIRQKAQSFGSDDDPLDLLPELEVQRALFSEFLTRFQHGTPLPQDAIYAMINWANDIGKMVERIVKMRNETALTKAEVAFIAARIADVVSKYIPDVDTQRAFATDLLAGIGQPQLAHSAGNRQESESQ